MSNKLTLLAIIIFSIMSGCRVYTYIKPQKDIKQSLEEKQLKEQRKKMCETNPDKCYETHYIY